MAVILALLFISPGFALVAGADRDHDLAEISHPGNVPRFADYTTPVIRPGETGVLNFTIENRYEGDITNLRLSTEIYRYATIETSRNISRISSMPGFAPDNGHTLNERGNIAYQHIDLLEPNSTYKIRYYITTSKSTAQGTYFVRVEMYFNYNGTGEDSEYHMRSRGYFSDELWDNATTKHEGDTDRTHGNTGNINLSVLGVDGILPDTSFAVKNPIPKWPLYLLGTLTAGFAGLAIAVYAYEEKSYPAFNRRVNHYLRKYNGMKSQFLKRIEKRSTSGSDGDAGSGVGSKKDPVTPPVTPGPGKK